MFEALFYLTTTRSCFIINSEQRSSSREGGSDSCFRLSSPAVSARIERLEKQGVIRAYTLDLDPLQLGHHILAYIHLDMQPTQKEEFYPFIAACSNVLECNCVTGNYSMLIKVSFASTQELDGFIGRLQKFGKTETQIVFSSPVPPRAIVV